MIVRFITGDQDEVDTFETASDSVKKQTCLLMSILNQYTSTAVMTGFMKAVQKEGTGMATTEDSNLCKAGTGMNFTLNRTADGDIQISFEQDVGISCVIITGDTYPYFLDYDRSCCHIGAEIKLTAESLETVANRDWTKLDYAAIKAEGQKCNTEGQLDLIPANYRLDTNISASLHFEIYTAKPEQDPTSDVYQKKMMEQMAGGDNNIITT